MTLFDLFVIKYVAKCPTSSYNTPVSICAMYGTLLKITKFPCDYLSRIRQVLTLREVEYLLATLRDGHRLQETVVILYYYSREQLLANEENANERHLKTIAFEALLMTMVMSALCKHI